MGRQRTLIAVAVLALVAAGCAKNDTTPSGSGSSPSNSPAAGATPLVNKGTADATAVTDKFEIELDNEGSSENYFKPTFIKVKPGQILTFDLKNEGTNPHTFTITSLGINKQIDPGTEQDVSITFPAAGGADIQFFCNFHVSLGMRGAFFFGAAPQTTGGTAGGSGTGSGSSDSY
jgi:plastocyanin